METPRENIRQLTRNGQPATFSPPLSMQQSIWDSITNGNFIDAKIFAYSRRCLGSRRAHTPKALFVNTHVLASACGYFRSTFDATDGIDTSLTAGLPPGFNPVFDMEEGGLNDYDIGEESSGLVDTQVINGAAAHVVQERTIKAYLVKDVPYGILRAVIWYIYSGEISFSAGSPGTPSVNVESIYRFAEEHGMDGLRSRAFHHIASSATQLEQSRLMQAAFDPFVSRYPELRNFYIWRLQYFLAYGPNEVFREEIFRYFAGGRPGSRELLMSLLQAVMDGPAINNPFRLNANPNNLVRVSSPWPTTTKSALLTSLDRGVLEDTRFTVSSGPGPAQQMHFAGVVNEQVGSSMSRICRPGSTSRHNGVSALTWQAILYYLYTNSIGFKPSGPQGPGQPTADGPSDTEFQGHQCSPREALSVALKLDGCGALVDLVANELASRMTPENVVQEMFLNSSTTTQIVERGLEIIRANRGNAQIRSQLQRIVEEGASGNNSANAAAFFACLIELLRRVEHS